MRRILLPCFLAIFTLSVTTAQKTVNPWKDISAQTLTTAEKNNELVNYRSLHLDYESVKKTLLNAPAGPAAAHKNSTVTIALPLPDGSFENFQVWETPVMQAELAAKYPQIKSYTGIGTKDRTAVAKFGFGPLGFHAYISSASAVTFIDKAAKDENQVYVAYYKKDFQPDSDAFKMECGYEPDLYNTLKSKTTKPQVANRSLTDPVILRTYRLAMAATAEYTIYHGGTVTTALAAINIKVNRLNGVFEREMAVTLILVNRNDQIIFTDPMTEPYQNGNLGQMISVNQTICDTRIGTANYDFGHVLGTNNSLSGLAQLGVICGQSKARGGSTIRNPVGDPFVIDIISHEMGHQFGANHTMSSCHNLNPNTAVELGGGVTIMSYSGICGQENNIAAHSYDYYHAISLDEIYFLLNHGNTGSCPEETDLGNTFPTVEIPLADGFYIPLSTPFELNAEGFDAEGDPITYNWEQFDVGPLNVIPGEPEGNCPLFRNFYPRAESFRTFPDITKVIANDLFSRTEHLPDYARDLTFRCVVRDNHPGNGGVVWDEVAFKVTDEAGPFLVEYPNSDTIEWAVGEQVKVYWDVANTDQSPVNSQRVNIKLSTNGGFTYPITLAESTINDGSESVFVPDAVGTKNRIRVEAADNVFFAISNSNFEIVPATTPGFTLSVAPNYRYVCLPESFSLPIVTGNILNFDSIIHLQILGDIPMGANISVSDSSIMPGDTALLIFDLENGIDTTFVSFNLMATANGADTVIKNFILDLVSNDFSSIEQLTPADGSAGISELPEFRWSGAGDAQLYDIQIATNPAFGPGDIVYEKFGILDTTYTPPALLDENTPYYWRIRPSNVCGTGNFKIPSAFHTFTKTCRTELGLEGDQRIPITGTGKPTIQSTISILDNGTINDLNVPNIRGSYDPITSIQLKLISPIGTEAILFEKRCNGAVFNFGFDDEIPNRNPCPAFDGEIRSPQDNLSRFNEENIEGTWTLQLDVVESGNGGGGSLEDWSLEFCADLSPSAPYIVKNDTMPIPPGAVRQISQEFLDVNDDNNSPAELTFTLVTIPKNGRLYFAGNQMQIGDQFRQSSINAGNVWYKHDNSQTVKDDFTFTVRDVEGGWLATPKFNIVVDENVIVSAVDPKFENEIMLRPNPAGDRVTLDFGTAFLEHLEVTIQNVSGKIVFTKSYQSPVANLTIGTTKLPAGLYFVTLDSEKGRFTKKLVVQR